MKETRKILKESMVCMKNRIQRHEIRYYNLTTGHKYYCGDAVLPALVKTWNVLSGKYSPRVLPMPTVRK